MEALSSLLMPPHDGLEAASLEAFWAACCPRVAHLPRPIDRAIGSGALADRAGYAFAAGYQAALAALFGPAEGGAMASLLVTEKGGGHPRQIEARLEPDGTGKYTLSGEKRWATMAPLSSRLFVAVIDATPDATPAQAAHQGRKRLRVVEVQASAPGVRVATMPATPFIPEVPHATVSLEAVSIEAAAVRPGDGYEAYVKPFRTVEDTHVLAALAGHLARVALRHRLPTPLLSELLALVSSLRSLAAEPPGSPWTHLALDACFSSARRTFEAVAAAWAPLDPEAHARWQRDAPLLEVASTVRALRTRAAAASLLPQP
jgi:acyl-CoA dehydrogenase